MDSKKIAAALLAAAMTATVAGCDREYEDPDDIDELQYEENIYAGPEHDDFDDKDREFEDIEDIDIDDDQREVDVYAGPKHDD